MAWRCVLDIILRRNALTHAHIQHVEVSAQYMAQAKADIIFVTEPLTETPEDLPVMNAATTEACDGGGGDKPMPENCCL